MTIAVDAVVYYRVQDATMSIANVENADGATRLLAQTTLRNMLGTKTLAEVLTDREYISNGMQVAAYLFAGKQFFCSNTFNTLARSDIHMGYFDKIKLNKPYVFIFIKITI